MINSKKQSFIVIGVFALVLMLGTVTYAFFNYTRTGSANTIRTGTISFLTTQSSGQNGSLELTNVFPMSAADAANANLDTVEIRIQGNTTYSGGEEFEITIVDVNNTVNNKTIPINYIASYATTPVQSGDPNVIGTSSDSYFTARGQSSAVYQLGTTGEATSGEQVLVGFIPADVTIDGTLTIKAYLDMENVVISDTYYENAPTPTPAAPNDEYGTPASFGEGKTVLTTTEWNSLQNTGTPLSFKIQAVSKQGTWVEEPVVIPTIASCPGCYFMYTTNTYNWGGNGSTVADITTNDDHYYEDYNDVISSSNKNYFLGFTLENGRINRAFACGIYNDLSNSSEIPFCIEGTVDYSLYDSNKVIVDPIYGIGSYPGCYPRSPSAYGCVASNQVGASFENTGRAWVDINNGFDYCSVYNDNTMKCRLKQV